MASFAPTPQTTVRRGAKRAVYDVAAVHAILDEAFACTISYVPDGGDGGPVTIPQGFVRVDDHLYVHGKASSALIRALESGRPTCVTVTLLDGMVLARSAFHHSMNYRSVVAFGAFEAVREPAAKNAALKALIDKVATGRWPRVKQPSPDELRATGVVRLRLERVSAKVRAGPPVDDAVDVKNPLLWAGVVPLRRFALPAEADPSLLPGVRTPAHVRKYANVPQLPRFSVTSVMWAVVVVLAVVLVPLVAVVAVVLSDRY